MNKLVNIIVFFLQDGEKVKHKVSSKIKNYPKSEQESAVRYLIDNSLVMMREVERSSGRGRKPVMISLTPKGVEFSKGLSRTPTHKGLWFL